MSQADIERFVADLKASPELLDEVKQAAGGLGSVVEFAKGKGYDITLDEAKAYINAQAGSELSDEQLDALAGGKGSAPAQTTTVVAPQVQMMENAVVTSETQTHAQQQAQVVVVIDGGIAATTVV